jgi:excisionase family DNA binding protein
MKTITLNITIPEEMLQKLIEQEVSKIIRERAETVLTADPVMDTVEAAAYLKMARSTLLRKCHEKAVPYSKNGSKLKFRKSELDEFIKAGKKMTSSEVDTLAANHIMRRPRAAM